MSRLLCTNCNKTPLACKCVRNASSSALPMLGGKTIPLPLARPAHKPGAWLQFDTYNLTSEQVRDAIGAVPSFLDPANPLPAKDQIAAAYGEWKPMDGFTMEGVALNYPQDPTLYPIAATILHTDLILVYPHAWVCVVDGLGGGTFEVARLN